MPAAAAAPLPHWSWAELAPGLGLLEGGKKRLRGQRQREGLWLDSSGMSTETLTDGKRDGGGEDGNKERNTFG